MTHSRTAVVLLSGGLDSAVTLARAGADGFQVVAVTIRYGQRHHRELEFAQAQAEAVKAGEHLVVDIDLRAVGGSSLTGEGPVPKARSNRELAHSIPNTYVPARNTIFLAYALAVAESRSITDIYIGANAIDYSGYPDCRPEFIEAFERLACQATKTGVQGTRYRIHAPLLNMTKAEIIRLGNDLGVDFGRTWSCYDPTASGLPCGGCDACRLRSRGFRQAGLTDPWDKKKA